MAWRGSVQSLCELLLQDNLAVLHEAFAQEKQNWIELVGWALELQVKIVYDCLKCQLYCPVMQSETIAITISRLTMHCWTPRSPGTRKDRRPTGIPNERHRHRFCTRTQIHYNSASAATFAGQAMWGCHCSPTCWSKDFDTLGLGGAQIQSEVKIKHDQVA